MELSDVPLPPSPRYLVTGATGQLGRLVVAELLQRVPASAIAIGVRDPARAADLAELGITVRHADYADPGLLEAAFAGVERVLLIASNGLGHRREHHRNAIAAAQRAGTGLLAFTSLLHADRSPLRLAEDYRDAEAALRASGVPFALLRNGWYTENFTASVAHAVATGVHAGSAGTGHLSTAARADYAAAAAAVLTAPDPAGEIHELAGDNSFTLDEYAAAVSRISGKPVRYLNLPEADYRQGLIEAGLPASLAEMLADAEVQAVADHLFDDSRTLSRLVGRPTTPLETTLRAALASV